MANYYTPPPRKITSHRTDYDVFLQSTPEQDPDKSNLWVFTFDGNRLQEFHLFANADEASVYIADSSTRYRHLVFEGWLQEKVAHDGREWIVY